MTRRSSARGAAGQFFGRCGSSTAHASSLSQSSSLMPIASDQLSGSHQYCQLYVDQVVSLGAPPDGLGCTSGGRKQRIESR